MNSIKTILKDLTSHIRFLVVFGDKMCFAHNASCTGTPSFTGSVFNSPNCNYPGFPPISVRRKFMPTSIGASGH